MNTIRLKICGLAVCSICTVLNILAIITLVKSKKLKQCTFKRLVLCLSISDLELVFGISLHIVIALMDNGEPQLTYVYLVLEHLIAGAFMFSLFQCLLICFERLNATFASRNKYLQSLSSIKAIGLGFVALNSIMVTHLGFDIWQGQQHRCSLTDVWSLSFVLAVDLPTIVIYLLTIFIYAVIIARVIKHNRKTQNRPNGSSKSEQEKVKRRRLGILGAIIVVSLLSNVPWTFMKLYSINLRPSEKLLWFNIGPALLLVNPLFDPFVYVFCIKEFRDKLIFICKKKSNAIIKPITDFENPVRRNNHFELY